MGRRTTSTTKGGKFMNPTDQARKEARRRELKKNKKQRIAVRQAVIKTKNPYQMLRELEDLDDMELDPTFESQYNEKVMSLSYFLVLFKNLQLCTYTLVRVEKEKHHQLRDHVQIFSLCKMDKD